MDPCHSVRPYKIRTLGAFLVLLQLSTIKVAADDNYNFTQSQLTDTTSVPTSPSTPTPTRCRYWNGYADLQTYTLTTCAHCYMYLFPENRELIAYGPYLVSNNGTVYPHGTFVPPDLTNPETVSNICKTLQSKVKCEQWLQCCEAATLCCASQLEDESKAVIGGEDSRVCPGTWDGYACWSKVKAGRKSELACPGFIPHAMPSANAMKTCTENGSWYADPFTNKEWTNYTTCLQFDEFKINIYIKLACNALSLLALIPSLVIYITYRSLRNQHRVRLHIHLFSSFILYAFINILWEVLVVYERMNKETSDTRMARNTAGCKFLYVLTRYSRSTNYLWMFCEGLYLHRLIVKAFTPPKKLILFYILGWGFPWLPVGVYSILRIFHKNESCWVQHIGPYEWIIYIPNFVALVMNLVFLIDILRILLTQLQSHPNEPSNYRRALKATFVLVPLFGLQLFLVIYRPPLGTTAGAIYENVSAVIVNSQGFFVAVIFCLINSEVHANLRRTCARYGCGGAAGYSRSQNVTMTTQASDAYSRDSPNSSFRAGDVSVSHNREYVALRPMEDVNGHVN